MTYTALFDDLMPHTVTLAAIASVDAYNKPTYATATSHTARVLYRNSRVVSFEGAEITATGMVWISGSPTVPTVTPDMKMTLPDGTTPPILAVEIYPDEDGSHHVKVFFGHSDRAA